MFEYLRKNEPSPTLKSGVSGWVLNEMSRLRRQLLLILPSSRPDKSGRVFGQQRYKLVLLIFLVALVFRLYFFGFLLISYGPGSFYLEKSGEGLTGNDVQYYVLIAKNLAEHQVYSSFLDPPFQPTSFRTPLMPFYFLPFIYLFGLGSIWLAILILDIILSLTPVIAYFLAKLFVSNKSALIIGFLVALEPVLAFYSNFVGPDALLVLLFLLALYHLILFWQKGKRQNLYYSAVFLGFSALAKPIAAYLAIPFVIFILFKLFFEKIKFKELTVQLGLFIIIFGAIIFPWLLRNYLVFGSLGFSSVLSHNLYAYYTNDIKLDNEKVNYSPQDRDPSQSLRYQKQLIGIALRRIEAQPVVYFKNHLLGTIRYFFASDLQSFYYSGYQKLLPFKYNPIHDIDLRAEILKGNYKSVLKFIFNPKNFAYLSRHILLALFYLVILSAWLKSFKRDKKIFVIFSFFLLLTFYFIFAPGPYVDPKYRLPAIPLLLIVFFYNFSRQESKNEINKKIIIAAEIFPPDIGGPATYSKMITEQLVKQGREVSLICFTYEPQNGQHIFPIKRILRGRSKIIRHLAYLWHLSKMARKTAVIYAQGPASSGLMATIAGFLVNKKVVIKVVGDYAWEQARNLGKTNLGIDEFQSQKFKGKIGWLKFVEKFTCQKAAKIIVPSQYLKKIVRGWGVSEGKIEVVYNAISLPLLSKGRLETNQDLILSIGRLVPWKGFKTLIELVPELCQFNPNFRLVILGDGPEEKNLKSQILNLKIEDKVEVKKVTPEIRDQYLQTAKVFVLNTGYEGLPHTVLEAMAAGTPVITTNVCGNPEVVQGGYNGLLVEYNNKQQLKEAILKLYNNPELRQKFVQNSREVLKKFSFEEMINKTINIFKSL